MEEFKLAHFHQENPSVPAFACRAVDAAEAASLRSRLALAFGLDGHSDLLTFTKGIQQAGIGLSACNADGHSRICADGSNTSGIRRPTTWRCFDVACRWVVSIDHHGAVASIRA